DEAVRHYQQALSLHPDFFQAHSNLAELYLAQGRADEALPHYEKLVEIAPNNAVANYHLGVARLRQGRRDEAAALLARAVAAKPDMAAGYARLGDLALSGGDWPEAIRRYDQAARTDAGDTRSLYLESLAATARGDAPGAIACLRRALAVQPNNPIALARLAMLLATWPDPAVRDGREALRLARQAADLSNQGNGAILDVLAASLAEAGQFEPAVSWAERAARLASSRGRAEAARTFASHAQLFAKRLPLRTGAEPPPADLLAELQTGG
ncbi:MAG TPA: tetratricopeptide repeat protein, partial [Thermoanaerobaculia bacterium]|nr:tetratricopeptide repeat protein [Thermoanaerobaculia bacterium]